MSDGWAVRSYTITLSLSLTHTHTQTLQAFSRHPPQIVYVTLNTINDVMVFLHNPHNINLPSQVVPFRIRGQ